MTKTCSEYPVSPTLVVETILGIWACVWLPHFCHCWIYDRRMQVSCFVRSLSIHHIASYCRCKFCDLLVLRKRKTLRVSFCSSRSPVITKTRSYLKYRSCPVSRHPQQSHSIVNEIQTVTPFQWEGSFCPSIPRCNAQGRLVACSFTNTHTRTGRVCILKGL
jgi:hypothetical protein